MGADCLTPCGRMEELKKRLEQSLKVEEGDLSEIRLTYFPIRGRAEIARLILVQAGVDYRDIRIKREDFLKVKSILPYGSLPILEYKGEVIAESMAIAKLLAEHCGLAGSDRLVKARADEVAQALNGFLTDISKFFFAPEETRDALRKEFCEKTLPPKFSQLEARLCQNGGQHFAGENLTYADLMLVVINDNLRSEKVGAANVIGNYPRLSGLYDRLVDLPNIKAWRESRPFDTAQCSTINDQKRSQGR